MKNEYQNQSIRLSHAIAGVSVFASVGGLLFDGLYRGTGFLVSTWPGNDLVTLILAAPLLVVSALYVSKGSKRAILIWTGMLYYMMYNYAFYLFGAAFNEFFFVYVFLFALSIWALAMAFLSLEMDEFSKKYTQNAPIKTIAGFMVFVGISLTVVYFLQWLEFMRDGVVPIIIELTGHPTNLVFALDLSIVVPVLLVGAFLLVKQRPWGYVLAAMVNVKATVYMLALSASSLSAYRTGTVDSIEEVSLWLFIAVGSGIASLFLLRNLQARVKAE